MSDHERSGWRDDERISRKHREWGANVPIVDVDFLVFEYESHKAVALIDYKHEARAIPEALKRDANWDVYVDVADRAKLYAWIVRYADDFSWLVLYPMNEKAYAKMPELGSRIGVSLEVGSSLKLTEKQYVEFLHFIRGRIVPVVVEEEFFKC